MGSRSVADLTVVLRRGDLREGGASASAPACELLRAQSGTDYRAMEAEGALLAVTSLLVKYKSPARYDDVIEVETRVERVRRARIDHSYVIRRDGLVLATAETTLACLDGDGRPRALPECLVVGSE